MAVIQIEWDEVRNRLESGNVDAVSQVIEVAKSARDLAEGVPPSDGACAECARYTETGDHEQWCELGSSLAALAESVV